MTKWLATIAFLFGQAAIAASPSTRPTIAVYYFPDYHPNEPLNDIAHGKGWTEWELVKIAKPLYPGHVQPKVPLWGYTDESDPKQMQRVIDTAVDAGIDSFIFDFYWYNNAPFLEKCLDEGFLHAKNRSRLQFALMWANHDWIDIFPVIPGKQAKLMYPGKCSPESFDHLCDHLIKDYFSQPNYWKIDGKPYFSIYELFRLVDSFGSVDATRAALDRFRAKAVAAGLPGIHLNAVVWGVQILPQEHTLKNPRDMIQKLGFDSVTSYVWIHHAFPDSLQTEYNSIRDKYLAYWNQIANTYSVPYFPNLTMGWDPGGRNYLPSRTMVHNTPQNFGQALKMIIDKLESLPTMPKVITVNSWNEWTEGSYLEPDTEHGLDYLREMKKALNR